MYVGKYRKYYHDSYEFVWDELSMEEGYAMIAVAMSLDGWLAFSGVQLSDGGYLRQEVAKLQAKKKT